VVVRGATANEMREWGSPQTVLSRPVDPFVGHKSDKQRDIRIDNDRDKEATRTGTMG
jgi:hypothetical protein